MWVPVRNIIVILIIVPTVAIKIGSDYTIKQMYSGV